uniref:(northern house mosquito) hypothetical protein n=1 Tax=Culex pipiens TaxID=7175 RepID=A0A8D8GIA5_CULPI
MRRFSESREYLYWRWRIRTRGRICVTSGMDDGRQLVTTNSACRTRPWLVIPAIGGRSPPQWLSSFLIIPFLEQTRASSLDGCRRYKSSQGPLEVHDQQCRCRLPADLRFNSTKVVFFPFYCFRAYHFCRSRLATSGMCCQRLLEGFDETQRC